MERLGRLGRSGRSSRLNRLRVYGFEGLRVWEWRMIVKIIVYKKSLQGC